MGKPELSSFAARSVIVQVMSTYSNFEARFRKSVLGYDNLAKIFVRYARHEEWKNWYSGTLSYVKGEKRELPVSCALQVPPRAGCCYGNSIFGNMNGQSESSICLGAHGFLITTNVGERPRRQRLFSGCVFAVKCRRYRDLNETSHAI